MSMFLRRTYQLEEEEEEVKQILFILLKLANHPFVDRIQVHLLIHPY